MKRRPKHRLGLRARRGVTLVELIVAVTILMIGLLTIVGISASVARGLGEARSDNLAAQAAASRFELLAATKCLLTDGTVTGLNGITLNSPVEVTTRGITERYRVVNAGNNTLMLYDTLTWQTRRVTRRQAFQSLIPCRSGA
jgi:Tfp pilus assembly protein PilV